VEYTIKKAISKKVIAEVISGVLKLPRKLTAKSVFCFEGTVL
jgi:hypothetical protein